MTNYKASITLPSDREIHIVREFKAPKHLVFETWVNTRYVAKWYGMCRFTLTTCEIDLREGGAWRWVLRDPETATDHAFSGEYRVIDRPNRLVFTERYEAIPGSDHEVTLTFREEKGVTSLHMSIVHSSRENRDGHLQSGMEQGMNETLDRLEALLATGLTSPV